MSTSGLAQLIENRLEEVNVHVQCTWGTLRIPCSDSYACIHCMYMCDGFSSLESTPVSIPSLPSSFHPSLPPSLPLPLFPSLPPSLTYSLTPYLPLPLSLSLSLPLSLSPSLPPSLPLSLPPSLPLSLSLSLPLFLSLPLSLPPSLPLSFSPFLPPSLPHSLLPSLSFTSAFLTRDNVELQELAANSDRLICTLVGYLGNQPDENDELVEEKHLIAFDHLREVWGGRGEGEGGIGLACTCTYTLIPPLSPFPSLPPPCSLHCSSLSELAAFSFSSTFLPL